MPAEATGEDHAIIIIIIIIIIMIIIIIIIIIIIQEYEILKYIPYVHSSCVRKRIIVK